MNVSSTCPSAVCRQGVAYMGKGREGHLPRHMAQTNTTVVKKRYATAPRCFPSLFATKIYLWMRGTSRGVTLV